MEGLSLERLLRVCRSWRRNSGSFRALAGVGVRVPGMPGVGCSCCELAAASPGCGSLTAMLWRRFIQNEQIHFYHFFFLRKSMLPFFEFSFKLITLKIPGSWSPPMHSTAREWSQGPRAGHAGAKLSLCRVRGTRGTPACATSNPPSLPAALIPTALAS